MFDHQENAFCNHKDLIVYIGTTKVPLERAKRNSFSGQVESLLFLRMRLIIWQSSALMAIISRHEGVCF